MDIVQYNGIFENNTVITCVYVILMFCCKLSEKTAAVRPTTGCAALRSISENCSGFYYHH